MNNLDKSYKPFEHLVDVFRLSLSVKHFIQVKGDYLYKNDEDYLSEKNYFTFNQIVVNILNVLHKGTNVLLNTSKWVFTKVNFSSSLLFLKCLSLFAAFVGSVKSFLNIFMIINKNKKLHTRINIEFNDALKMKNVVKEKEIQIYRIVKALNLMSDVYSLTLFVITILEFFTFQVFSTAGLSITLTAGLSITLTAGAILHVTSFVLDYLYDIKNIEKKYFTTNG